MSTIGPRRVEWDEWFGPAGPREGDPPGTPYPAEVPLYARLFSIVDRPTETMVLVGPDGAETFAVVPIGKQRIIELDRHNLPMVRAIIPDDQPNIADRETYRVTAISQGPSKAK